MTNATLQAWKLSTCCEAPLLLFVHDILSPSPVLHDRLP